jgi:hypothetical protein
MDPIPTPRQELERKTIDFLQAQVNRAETGRLEKRDLHLIGHALWHITSGLVDDTVSELCTAVAEAGKQPAMLRRFVGKGEVLIVAWNADKSGYVVQSVHAVNQTRTTIRKSDAEIGLREAELKKLFDGLSKVGYMEIN